MPRPVTTARRPADWPERLGEFIRERRTQPFVWGTQDCVTLACDAVVLMIGIDPWEGLRGTYATEAEAEAMTAAAGGPEALVAARMAAAGLPECSARFAQRGDVALVEIGNQLMLGVVLIGRVAVPGADRLQFVPMSNVRRVWAV